MNSIVKSLRFTALLILLIPTFCVLAEVRFSSAKYDFGRIREDGGPKAGSVTMTNLGPGPTYIRNVRTTCGCTAASFTEGMIEEGDSALVTFTYDPEGRPGTFDKSVKVFVGQDNKMHVVRISGTVLASTKTLSLNYPDSIGELRLSTKLVDGGEIPKGESRNYFVRLYNTTERAVRPTAKVSSEALSVAVEPQTIEPGETATVGIYLNTRREPEAGERKYEIEICSDADAMISEMGKVVLGARIQ